MDPEWSVIISVQEDEKMAKQIDDETMENVCILAKPVSYTHLDVYKRQM